MSTEAQIHADIDALRLRVVDTQDLYREVCTILFFRYGITPTANKLYQYVRKGSMSAPAEALAKFWEDLREKSRVRIERPDLPDALKVVAGELVASLWTQAQSAAQEGLAVFRANAQAEVFEAQEARRSAESNLEAVIKERDKAYGAAQAATDRSLQLERDFAGERAAKLALIDQLEAAARQQRKLESALTEARHDFTEELGKLRESLQLSDARFEAAEKRALLEIDRERITSVRLQKELDLARQYQRATEDRHRSEIERIQTDLSVTFQKLGIADGKFMEMQRTNELQGDELQTLRIAAAEGQARTNLLERELEISRENVAMLQQTLAQQEQCTPPESQVSKPKRRSRKANGLS
jgi:hypothetical protein